MGLPRENRLKNYADNLRINNTLAEKRLWMYFLREYETPFRQQKVIGPYIVDFFCNKARLSIELDGSQHYEEKGRKRDEIRTTFMEMLEIKELRFSNTDIFESFEGVCMVIDAEVKKRRNDLIELPLHNVRMKK